MTEEKIISDEDIDTVDSVYSNILDTKQPSTLTGGERVVYLVENYNQEINSGLDFIQWYRWSEPFQLRETPDALKTVGLTESYEICIEALRISFSGGLPTTSDEKDNAIDSLEDDEDKEETREALAELAHRQEEQNYNLTSGLASWIRGNMK